MKNIQYLLSKLIGYLEIIITVFVIIGVAISMKTLIVALGDLYLSNDVKNAFLEFLAIAFNILIGIEFLKMIYNYNVDTVIEVLLFAIARQLIVEHTTIFENCIGVVAIGILFSIRKYFSVERLDKVGKAE